MSTTFEVFPGSASVPSFAELISAGQAALGAFLLRRTGRTLAPELAVTLIHCKTDERRPVDPSAPAIWDSDTYAWFTIADVSGGTDAYFEEINQNDRGYWNEELSDD